MDRRNFLKVGAAAAAYTACAAAGLTQLFPPPTPVYAPNLAEGLYQQWDQEIMYAVNNTRGITAFITETGSNYFGPGGKVNWPTTSLIESSTSNSSSVSSTSSNGSWLT